MVLGFQDASEKVWLGSWNLVSSRMEAKDEVMTTRRTDGAERLRARRMPVVPTTAGAMSSVSGSANLPISLHISHNKRSTHKTHSTCSERD